MVFKMNVTVSSALCGDSSGYIVFQVPSDYLIGNLLKLYCSEKGIEVAADYVLCGKGNILLDPLKTLEEEHVNDGENIQLTQIDKNEQLYAFGSWWTISLAAFLIGSTGFAYAFYLFYHPQALPQKYGLVIDAGSSHSQLFIFSWSQLKSPGTADVELVHDCTMSGGIAGFRSHLQDLPDYFRPCFSEAEAIVPVSSRPSTPLILAGTGGMRILRAYDPTGTSLVLSTIREFFRSKTTFLTRPRDVFVVSGQQEAISGWAALNYLMENFEQSERGSESGLPHDKDEAQASALDLGGASVQVTTELSRNASLWPTVNITIFNSTYRIYSKSFLCYGVGEAMHRYQFLLVRDLQKKRSPGVVLNPCLPRGFQMSFTSRDFFNPCIFSSNVSVPSSAINFQSKYVVKFASKYFFKVDDGGGKDLKHGNWSTPSSVTSNETIYILRGSSDTKLCRKKVESLFDYASCKENFALGDCLNKKLVPPYKGELVGFSSIFHKLLPLLGVSPEGSLEEFKNAVLQSCSLSSEELLGMHPNVSLSLLEDLCFDSMYVYTLLKEGLGITSKRWKNILFANKVNEQEVVWAMGLMLNRTSYSLPLKSTDLALPSPSFTSFFLLLLLFSVFAALSMLFLWYTLQMRRRGNLYQRVLTSVLDS